MPPVHVLAVFEIGYITATAVQNINAPSGTEVATIAGPWYIKYFYKGLQPC